MNEDMIMTYTDTQVHQAAMDARDAALCDYMVGERRGGMNAAVAAGYQMYSTLASVFCAIYNSQMDDFELNIA